MTDVNALNRVLDGSGGIRLLASLRNVHVELRGHGYFRRITHSRSPILFRVTYVVWFYFVIRPQNTIA